MKVTSCCPHCGAKMMEYKFSLSKGMVAGLLKLDRAGGGPIKVGELNLTPSQYVNFQKLRYWGFIRTIADHEGNTRTGIWEITTQGKMFINGNVRYFKNAFTYRGKVTKLGGDPVAIWEVDPEYKKRLDYVREARPIVDEDGQSRMAI